MNEYCRKQNDVDAVLLCTVRSLLKSSPHGTVNESVYEGLTALHQVNTHHHLLST